MHWDIPPRKPVLISSEMYHERGLEQEEMTVKAGYLQRPDVCNSRLCNRTHSVIETALCDEQEQFTSAGWENTSAHSHASSLSRNIYRQICDFIGGSL